VKNFIRQLTKKQYNNTGINSCVVILDGEIKESSKKEIK